MTRTTLIAALIVAGSLATAVPALAEDDGSHVCVAATRDRNNPGPSVVCVWVPVGKTG